MINAEIPRGYKHRPKPPAELPSVLHEQFGLSYHVEPKDLGGSQNLNLMIDANGKRYVARVYRPWVSEARIKDINLARRALMAGEVPMPRLVMTRDGRDFAKGNEQFIEVEEYVEHDAIMDNWERIEQGMPWLGRIHNTLEPLTASPEGLRTAVSNNIDADKALGATVEAANHIRQWDDVTPDELQIADSAEDLAHRITELERSLVPDLPRQLVHGDFWDNNVFFRNSNIVSIVDLDFMGLRPRIDDLALTLFYTNSTFYRESQTSKERAHQLRQLAEAYNSGLDEKLTDVEKSSLVFALAREVLAFIGMVPVVEDGFEDGVDVLREHVNGRKRDVDWSLAIAKNPKPWQTIFEGIQ